MEIQEKKIFGIEMFPWNIIDLKDQLEGYQKLLNFNENTRTKVPEISSNFL